jgi:hypothetical protein
MQSSYLLCMPIKQYTQLPEWMHLRAILFMAHPKTEPEICYRFPDQLARTQNLAILRMLLTTFAGSFKSLWSRNDYDSFRAFSAASRLFLASSNACWTAMLSVPRDIVEICFFRAKLCMTQRKTKHIYTRLKCNAPSQHVYSQPDEQYCSCTLRSAQAAKCFMCVAQDEGGDVMTEARLANKNKELRTG